MEQSDKRVIKFGEKKPFDVVDKVVNFLIYFLQRQFDLELKSRNCEDIYTICQFGKLETSEIDLEVKVGDREVEIYFKGLDVDSILGRLMGLIYRYLISL